MKINKIIFFLSDLFALDTETKMDDTSLQNFFVKDPVNHNST